VMRCFGFTPFAVRFPAALALFLSGVTGLLFAKRLRFSPAAALAAEAMILTNFNFLKMSRRAMVDLPLAFCILLAVAAFHAMRTERKNQGRFLWFCLFAGALTAGGYTKGILGVGLPVAILGVWLLLCDIGERKFRFFSYFALGMGMLTALGMMALWYWALARRGAELLHTALVINNLGRFSGEQGDHVGEWFYYLPRLPQMFQPYLILLPVAFLKYTRQIFRKKEEGRLLLFIASLLPLLIFQCAAAKRPVYLLPLLPFWALFTAPLADEILRLRKRCSRPGKSLPLYWTIAGIAVVAAVIFDFTYAGILKNGDGMAECYRYLRQEENAGRKVILLNPLERTQGAVWFYLQHGAPECVMKPAEMEAGPAPGEVWLWRDKKRKPHPSEIIWNDSHRTRI